MGHKESNQTNKQNHCLKTQSRLLRPLALDWGLADNFIKLQKKKHYNLFNPIFSYFISLLQPRIEIISEKSFAQ